MSVLCDAHMSYRLVDYLRERGIDATHVNRILDGAASKDAAVAEFADASQMVLITKDNIDSTLIAEKVFTREQVYDGKK